MTMIPIGSLSGIAGSSLQPGAPSTGASSAQTEGASGKGGFAGALGNALSSLEQSQQTANAAAQGLATGTVSNPEGAVVQVEQAQLEMQFASQIRAKATEAIQNVFQTQI